MTNDLLTHEGRIAAEVEIQGRYERREIDADEAMVARIAVAIKCYELGV